jgi:surfeit locus 1 family protein
VNAPARRHRSWIGALALALPAFAVLIALGTWQLERKAWKEALIARLTDRLAAPPAALPPPSAWSTLERNANEYRKVKLDGEFDNADAALVYGAASALRPDVSGPGYWVFTPLRLAGGDTFVMVNRGFVPEAEKDAVSQGTGQLLGPVAIVGAMRWPEARHWFSPPDDPAHNLWFTRDPRAIAEAKGIHPVAPFYVEQESPVPRSGLPRPGRIAVRLRNAHLQYALTWYGLALVLVVVVVARSLTPDRRAEAKPRPSSSHS